MYATDYRPQTFEEVEGQELAKASLKRVALSEGIKVRGILLQGAWGSGKTTLARIFAKAVNCEEFKKTGEVCNKCSACLEASSRSSQVYQEYDATKVGNVDMIRSLLDSLQIKNYEGRRVICIDEVHTASRQAQSALLKALEDGIPDTFMVFCTTDEVIKTIKSRSMFLEITTLSDESIKNRVSFVAGKENLTVDDKQMDAIVLKSQGHMRDALAVLEHFSIVGDEALKTSLGDLRSFMLAVLKKKEDEPYEPHLQRLLKYPISDIQNSIRFFIKTCLVAKTGFEGQIRAKGLAIKLFRFFYAPEAQQAVKDEAGIEILLRALADSL